MLALARCTQVRKHVYCGNCGKYGHVFKYCSEPIISIGVIAFSISKKCIDPADSLAIVAPLCSEQHELAEFFLQNTPRKPPINIDTDSIRFLMIRRKNTLGYMEFMRGRYQVTRPDTLVKLIELMVADEINAVCTSTFDSLWKALWLNKSKFNNQEYKTSKNKFDYVTRHGILRKVTQETAPLYTYPEWGFPKGRRNMQEKNMQCGLREFEEETGYTRGDIQILDKLDTFEETFKGTNNIPYKHIYFLSHCMFAKDTFVSETNHEIGDIGWFTLAEALGLIRNRHAQRKHILTDIHCQIMSWLQLKATPDASHVQTAVSNPV